MYYERIKVIISQAGSNNKTEILSNGVGVAEFDFTKTFRNQLFSRERVFYHQCSITNFKVQNHKRFNDFLLFFLSDLVRNILKCNCSPYSTSYLPGALLCSNVLSCQPRVTVTPFYVYKVIRDLESIDHLCINPIHRIGLIHK